jgi:hypothetical protein
MPLFLTPFSFRIHSYNHTVIHLQQEEPPWVAKPRIEMGPALQQDRALPTELRAPFWNTPHLTELRLTLLKCAAPYRASLLRHTVLSYAEPYWNTPHYAAPTWASRQRHTLLSYAAPYSLRRTLLSYAAPFWGTPHSNDIRCTLMTYATPYGATPHPHSWHDLQKDTYVNFQRSNGLWI